MASHARTYEGVCLLPILAVACGQQTVAGRIVGGQQGFAGAAYDGSIRYAKGADLQGQAKGVVGADFVKKSGGRVVLVPLLEGRSTTNLIERIRGGA